MIHIDIEMWKDSLVAEQLTLSLLGKLWFEYPEQAFIQNLITSGVFDELPFAGEQPDVKEGLALLQTWIAQNQDGLPDDAFDAIRSDYTRLFIGPGKVKAPPWESVYYNESRAIFQEQTLQVREWYRRFGLESVKIHNEPDDHVGLELAFMAHLAGQAVAALEAQDQPEFDRMVAAQREFATAHLFSWYGGWFLLVDKMARTDFYRGMALITRGVLLEVATMLSK